MKKLATTLCLLAAPLAMLAAPRHKRRPVPKRTSITTRHFPPAANPTCRPATSRWC